MKVKYEKINGSYDFDMEVELKDYMVVLVIIAIFNYEYILSLFKSLM